MAAVSSPQLESDPHIVRVAGEVHRATVKELEHALLDAVESRSSAVIVDLTDCTLLDACALRALVDTSQRLERPSRRLALVVSTPRLQSVFQITRLDDVFEIHPSLGAAVDGDQAA
jgi:anti-sigma B factor antagonist